MVWEYLKLKSCSVSHKVESRLWHMRNRQYQMTRALIKQWRWFHNNGPQREVVLIQIKPQSIQSFNILTQVTLSIWPFSVPWVWEIWHKRPSWSWGIWTEIPSSGIQVLFSSICKNEFNTFALWKGHFTI